MSTAAADVAMVCVKWQNLLPVYYCYYYYHRRRIRVPLLRLMATAKNVYVVCTLYGYKHRTGRQQQQQQQQLEPQRGALWRIQIEKCVCV